MPIYEYRCNSCQGVSSFFTKSINSTLEAVCTHCQSRDMARRMSSFAMGKSGRPAFETNPAGSGRSPSDYYSDPRNIGRNVEESFSRHGLGMPQSVRDSIDAARQGEAPAGLGL